MSEVTIFGGVSLPAQRILFQLTGADMNSVLDQTFIKMFQFTTWVPMTILALNPSVSMTGSAGGIYPAASKGGTAIVGAGQVYTALTAATKNVGLAVSNSDTQTITPILSLTTGHGSAATADFLIMGVAVN